jgi:hypothetical protein
MTSYDNNTRWDITLNATERDLVIRALLALDVGLDTEKLNSINAVVNDLIGEPTRIVDAK